MASTANPAAGISGKTLDLSTWSPPRLSALRRIPPVRSLVYAVLLSHAVSAAVQIVTGHPLYVPAHTAQPPYVTPGGLTALLVESGISLAVCAALTARTRSVKVRSRRMRSAVARLERFHDGRASIVTAQRASHLIRALDSPTCRSGGSEVGGVIRSTGARPLRLTGSTARLAEMRSGISGSGH